MLNGVGRSGSSIQTLLDGEKPTTVTDSSPPSTLAASSWKFDRELAVRRAQRQHQDSANEARSSLAAVEETCSEVMNKVRSVPELREKFSQELRILDARLRCLHLVLAGPVLALQV